MSSLRLWVVNQKTPKENKMLLIYKPKILTNLQLKLKDRRLKPTKSLKKLFLP
jgi:hypothetical protein